MITVFERPYQICFTRNPIRYGFITDSDITQNGFTIEVRVMWRIFNSGNDFTEQLTLPLTPDSNKTAFLDLRTLIDSLVSYNNPDLTDVSIQPAPDHCVEFYVDYREVTEGHTDNEWTDGSSGISVGLKGGISYEKWQGPNYFVTYMATNKAFLTWQPNGRLCGPGELLFLYYLHTTANDAIDLKVTITYTDNTTQGATYLHYAEPIKYGVYIIPCGIAQLGLADVDSDKTIYYYDVEIINDGGTLAGPFRYYVDYRTFSSAKFGQLNYRNSLGGLDSIRILGEVAPVMKYIFDSVEQSVNGAYYNLHDLKPQLLQLNSTEQRTYKAYVGYLLPAEQDALREANIRRDVLYPRADRWLPVVITGQEMELAKNTDKRWMVTLDIQMAWNNENYTPDDAAIGDLPACTIPQALQVMNITGKVISLSWTGSPDAVDYVIEASGSWVGAHDNPDIPVKPVNRDWSVVGSSTATTFDYDAAGWVTVKIRVKAYCAVSASGYSNTVTASP